MEKYGIIAFGELLVDKLYDQIGNCLKVDGGDTQWNILYNLALMGEKCHAVGVVGNDKYGRIAVKSLEKVGIDITRIIVDNKNTNILHGIIKGDSDVVYTDVDPKTGEKTYYKSTKYPSTISGSLSKAKNILIFRDLDVNNMDFIKNVQTSKKVILDLGHVEFIEGLNKEYIDEFLKNVNICQINRKVIQDLLNILKLENIEQFFEEYYFELLIVTNGSQGATFLYVEDDEKTSRIDLKPDKVENVVEPSGAGDMFLSIFIKAYNRYLAQERKIDYEFINKTFKIANKFASRIIKKIGARADEKEFKTLFYSENELRSVLCERKERNKLINE